MLNWISKIDPNLLITLASALATAAVWGYHKLRGDATESLSEICDSIVANLMHEVLDDYSDQDLDVFLDTARAKIETNFWTIAEKRGIPKNAISIAVVHAATERGTAWLADQIKKRRDVFLLLKTEVDKVGDVAANFARAEAEGLARGRAGGPPTIDTGDREIP